jgi:PPOX class probable F420-dependent enzyme
MAEAAEKYSDLLNQKKAFANLATVMPDGTPQVTPVWFDYRGGVLRINTEKKRTKARNMKPGAAVAAVIVDPDNPYRYVQIRGNVARVAEEGADAHIDSLTKKYMGQDKYPYTQPGDVRIIIEITPKTVSGMG